MNRSIFGMGFGSALLVLVAGASCRTAHHPAETAVWSEPSGNSSMPDRRLSATESLEDVRLARRALELIHPGIGRYGPSRVVADSFDELERACADGLNERELFTRMSRVLALIRCSHTKIEPSKSWEQWRASSASYLPLRFAVEDGRMIVEASMVAEIEPGDEVVSIDGRSARAVLGAVFECVPADGFTDEARWMGVGGASDLDDCEFDHFYPFLFPMNDRVRLETRGEARGTSRVIDTPWVTRAQRRAALRRDADAANMDESVSLRLLEGGVGVLRIGTFVAYRKPIDPVDILRPHFERIAEAGCTSLIVDLRDNGGGSDSGALALARFLAKHPIEDRGRALVRTNRFGDLKDKLETWDRSVLEAPAELFTPAEDGYLELKRSAERVFEPLTPAFVGKLIVLTGPANASGSTMCIGALRSLRGATLIGERTGGSVEGPTAGVILFLPLEHSCVRVRVPAIRSISGLKGGDAGGGLTPDIRVQSTVRDRIAGRDPVLDAAIVESRRIDTPE